MKYTRALTFQKEKQKSGPSDELEEVEQELTKTDKKKDPDVEVRN
jgi:hypothetical protein